MSAFRKKFNNADTCVCCGAIIPEGAQVCLNCQIGIKPPIGVSPHWFVYKERITETSKAITRYSEFAGEHCNTKDGIDAYKAIVKWAEEIKMLAKTEIKLLTIDKSEAVK